MTIHISKRAIEWLRQDKMWPGPNGYEWVPQGVKACDSMPLINEIAYCSVIDVRGMYLGSSWQIGVRHYWFKGEFKSKLALESRALVSSARTAVHWANNRRAEIPTQFPSPLHYTVELVGPKIVVPTCMECRVKMDHALENCPTKEF